MLEYPVSPGAARVAFVSTKRSEVGAKVYGVFGFNSLTFAAFSKIW